MLQAKLLFPRITADEAAQQRDKIAQQHVTEHPLQVIVKRGPGRPPQPRPLPLADAAAAAAAQPVSQKRVNWFSSPYINDVLTAYRRYASAKLAIEFLKRSSVDGRFDSLSDSTVRAWFSKEDKMQLLPRFQAQFDEGRAAARGGRVPMLPVGVQEEVKRVLLQLRATGAAISTHVIRWTMRAVFHERDPSLLASLQLSQQWICGWVRDSLEWSWRHRTTAASKLPLDWEEQGMLMAKRIAVKMVRHNVSPYTCLHYSATSYPFLM
jgi:hypothetical protein